VAEYQFTIPHSRSSFPTAVRSTRFNSFFFTFSRGTVLEQVEKAYRELDARFCRMTGKKPDADELFGKSAVRQSVPAQKEAPENGARENRMCRRKGRRPGF
jgi:hypothetical protein